MQKEVKFIRKQNRVIDVSTNDVQYFPSINKAKQHVRKLITEHGLGSVQAIWSPRPKVLMKKHS